jgi:hypothetical protein
MRTYATQSLRTLLRNNPDGMDVQTMAHYLDLEVPSVRKRLVEMPDAYIDRWMYHGKKGMPSAIWCVVVPPENCPRPDPKRKPVKRMVESQPCQ